MRDVAISNNEAKFIVAALREHQVRAGAPGALWPCRSKSILILLRTWRRRNPPGCTAADWRILIHVLYCSGWMGAGRTTIGSGRCAPDRSKTQYYSSRACRNSVSNSICIASPHIHDQIMFGMERGHVEVQCGLTRVLAQISCQVRPTVCQRGTNRSPRPLLSHCSGGGAAAGARHGGHAQVHRRAVAHGRAAVRVQVLVCMQIAPPHESRMNDVGTELIRILERSLRISRAVDCESLCIVAGEKARRCVRGAMCDRRGRCGCSAWT